MARKLSPAMLRVLRRMRGGNIIHHSIGRYHDRFRFRDGKKPYPHYSTIITLYDRKLIESVPGRYDHITYRLTEAGRRAAEEVTNA